jgi:diaminohydroxyphosphoribosylaminopyrimidine deaminase/5-amino-6-(5-phosphoribosylamino)uracil reductase
MTLDGKIASRTGDSKWVTGEAARRYVHRLRAQSGAVMVGIETLLADDPLLTARIARTKLPRQPLRVVVDSRLRTPATARSVVSASADAPLLIATTFGADRAAENALARDGVRIIRLPAERGSRVELAALMDHLGRTGMISVLCEGGGELNASLIAAGLAHKAIFFVAPKIVGGRDARTPVEGAGVERMEDALSLERTRVRRFGADIAIEGYIKHPTLD